MASTSDPELMESDEEEVLASLTPREPPARGGRSSSASVTPTRRSSKTPGGLADQLFPDSDDEMPLASSSRHHASRTPTRPTRSTRSSSRRPPAVLVAPSSPDPLALDSEPEAQIGSVRSISEYSWTPMRRTVIEVEIPFQPLSKLMKYDLAEGLQPPTSSSRRRVLAETEKEAATGRRVQRRPPPRITKPVVRNRAVETPSDELYSDGDVVVVDDGDDGYSEGDTSSDGVLGHRRLTRGRSAPTWRTTRSNRKSPIRDHSESEASSDDQSSRKRRREPTKTRTAAAPAKKPKPKAKVSRTHRELSTASTASYHPTQKEWESEGEDEVDNEDDIYELQSSSDESRKATPLPTSRKILARHREICERCHIGPADELLERALKKKKKGKAPRRRKNEDDDWDMSEEERARIMMGWLECERCTVSWHWGCLKPNQRKDILHAFRTKDAPRRRNIEIHESATFLCESCETTPECFVCHHSRLPGEKAQKHPSTIGTTNATANGSGTDEPIVIDSDDDGSGHNSAPPRTSTPDERPKSEEAYLVADPFKPDGLRDSKPAPLVFRCFRCKLGVHYEHLKSPFPEGDKFALPSLAHVYQTTNDQGSAWYCHQCREWNFKVESIIAWRPWPADAIEPELEEDEVPLYRDPLPREYLVKFDRRSFRHVVWAPHPWVLKVAPQKLRNFVEKGPALNLITDETLASFGDTMEAPTIANVLEASERSKEHHGGVPPDPEAAESLPIAWSTVDRVLDAMLLPPKKRKGKGKGKSNGRVIESDSESEESDWEPVDGEKPPVEKAVEIERWENMAGRKLSEDDVDEVAPLVTWFMAKWDDLQYDQSCWDTPPPVDSELYPAFKHALKRYLAARRVKIPILNDQQIKARERLARTSRAPPNEQPECVVGGTLMPFQIEGFQWLTYKHLKRESCILADDMGLGKTIQVASFLGHLGSEDFGIYPALVIVPNSTITNWVREFEKWVPHLRVVPYYGVASSRKVVSEFELYHKGAQNKAAGLKAHVVLTTYDMITGSEFAVFSRMPRWEVVIVDEGQRLKSNTNLIFNRLKTLNSVHRILLTGTPLNNNLRELFNLLNFLDPESFRYLEELEMRFENLTESLIHELHDMIKPYILRRVKADVLKLPPKVEIIVPISLTPAQKALNKHILHRHKEAINNIMKQRRKKKAQAAKAKAKEVANGDAQPNGTAAVNGSKEGEGGEEGEGSKDGGAAPNGATDSGEEAGPSQTAAEGRKEDEPAVAMEVD